MKALSLPGQPYRLEVLVHGHPVEILQGTAGKMCVEGRDGSPYTLRPYNGSSDRVLFVPSVDGLSVMDGKRATSASSGYVVDPYGFVSIEGWRLSLDDVAQFTFGSKGGSYATQMDQPNNVGVIGVMVFREKYRPRPSLALKRMCLDSSVTRGGPESFGASKGIDQGMGTGFGPRVSSSAEPVEFKREDSPVAVLTLYYDDREGLIANHGVSFRHEAKVTTNGASDPQAFEFCTPPPSNRRR